jgi:hypothetical protein
MRNFSKLQLFGSDIPMVETQTRLDDDNRSGPLLWQQTEDPAFLIIPSHQAFDGRLRSLPGEIDAH